ncbi:hypothetical protein SAMN05421783_11294 [Thiocapsa roseopersicina]|uniref:Uncharacterized protein n=1 Tax=Thiocapsa roseopersicina TaxID=1058 RepID=A0A1H2Y8Q8_THIRO|nr:hypothetical protein SAMN05421783_11294 [Thiocapsa roseopersicina]
MGQAADTAARDEPASKADFDFPWKEAQDAYSVPLMALFVQAVHNLIDWVRPHEFLDTELYHLIGDSEIGRRHGPAGPGLQSGGRRTLTEATHRGTGACWHGVSGTDILVLVLDCL